MALSANQDVQIKKSPVTVKAKCVDGALHIYKGALLEYEANNIGYVQEAADELTAEFAGIAMEELEVAAADNAADGTYEIEMLPRGCGEWVKMNVRSNITIANIGDPVYMDGDDYVDISSGIASSTTLGLVGIIREFVSTNVAWVQMVQHPTL